MVHTITAWFLSQAAMASVLGDWFFIKKDNTTGDCQIYKGDAHNLFGNICDQSIKDIEPTVQTLQALVCTNLALSVIYFFATYLKEEMIFFKILLSFVVFVIGLITCILWHTTDKENMPSGVNYFGVGWYFQLVVVVFALTGALLNFTGYP